MPTTVDLLDEIATLKAMLAAAETRDQRRDERIARLEKLVAAFKQAAFGRGSEKSDPDQFELALEYLETAMAVSPAYLAESDIALAIPAIAAGLTVPVLGLVRTGEI